MGAYDSDKYSPESAEEMLALHYDAAPDRPYTVVVPPVAETRESQSSGLEDEIEGQLHLDLG